MCGMVLGSRERKSEGGVRLMRNTVQSVGACATAGHGRREWVGRQGSRHHRVPRGRGVFQAKDARRSVGLLMFKVQSWLGRECSRQEVRCGNHLSDTTEEETLHVNTVLSEA